MAGAAPEVLEQIQDGHAPAAARAHEPRPVAPQVAWRACKVDKLDVVMISVRVFQPKAIRLGPHQDREGAYTGIGIPPRPVPGARLQQAGFREAPDVDVSQVFGLDTTSRPASPQS